MYDAYLGGAVEARPQRGERAEHDAAGVALDGVVRPDAGQQSAPQLHLVDDVVHVAQVERVLLARRVAHGAELVHDRVLWPQDVDVVLSFNQALHGDVGGPAHSASSIISQAE